MKPMKRLLVVDDDQGLVSLLKRFLEAEGFMVDTAYDQPTGLKAALSGEHEIIYEYRVNGRVVSRYSYKKAITRSINLWKSNDTTHGLGKDGLEWARSTADRFLQDSASDAALAAVVEEYNAYFTPTAVPTG